MALHLNLYHEIEREKQAKARDPLKLSMMGLGFIAALFAGYYFWQLNIMSGIRAELDNKKAEFKKLEPRSKAAEKAEAELATMLKVSRGLSDTIEGRFFWAPVLEQIAKVVPPEVQVSRLSGEVQGEAYKKCLLTLNGTAAGLNPRKSAEDLRSALATAFGAKFKAVSASFRTLEDGTELASLDGKKFPTATFQIAVSLTVTEEPVATPVPVRKVKKG